MTKLDLLKKLLPGFVPILIFILIDEVWGTIAGIVFAVLFGVLYLIYTYFKEKKLDKFVLVDTSLIVLLGGVSIILDNDVFFKLKPALVETILVAILGYSGFSSNNIILKMTSHYIKDINFSNSHIQKVTKSLRVLFFVFLVHTILIYYSVYFLSDEAWAFISGALFYVIFGVYFIIEYSINNLFKDTSIEYVPVIDDKGNFIKKENRKNVHNGSMQLHPVVHLHIINDKKILLQKRAKTKKIMPNMWDTSVGGHVDFGENVEESLKRETTEEIGIRHFNFKFLHQYIWESEIEREMVFSFVSFDEKEIACNKKEISECKFWSRNEIENDIKNNIFTPNFLVEFEYLVKNNYL